MTGENMNEKEALQYLESIGFELKGTLVKEDINGWVEYEERDPIPLLVCELNKKDNLCSCGDTCIDK